MIVRTVNVLSVLTCIVLYPCTTAQAQAPGSPSVFLELFPQPTGQNGYEEIVAAGDMLAHSKAYIDFEQKPSDTVTLSEKRAILADPIVHDALLLFHHGIGKSLNSPRFSQPEASYRAFALYRRLARLLFVEEYTLCADGLMNRSLDTLQEGLQFGYSVQSDSMLGGLVGIAIDSIVIKAIDNKLDLLSERDCKRLSRLARAWLEAPDPAISALTAERDTILKNMQAQFPADASFPRVQALTGTKLHIDYYISNLTKPYWERKPPPPLQGDKQVAEYVGALMETLDPTLERAQSNFVRDQARMQLLGVNAAIRGYRWEHNVLPASLEVLNLGLLAHDPFTGRLLEYKVSGPTTYELNNPGMQP